MGTPAQDVIAFSAQRAIDLTNLSQLQTFKSDLEAKLIAAKAAYSLAESNEKTAKQQKSAALTMEEMGAAVAALENAKSASADAVVLIDNIETALRHVPGRIQQATVNLQMTTQSLWRAHGDVLVEDAATNAEFQTIRTLVRSAYVCRSMGAYGGGNFKLFLKEIFGDEMAGDIDEAEKAALRASLSATYGL